MKLTLDSVGTSLEWQYSSCTKTLVHFSWNFLAWMTLMCFTLLIFVGLMKLIINFLCVLVDEEWRRF